MNISIFEMFSIGIGPSSSHTVGPMRAANRFLAAILTEKLLPHVSEIKIELYGSLALTGKGHATDSAILMGLMGFTPESIAPESISPLMLAIQTKEQVQLAQTHAIAFIHEQHFVFHYLKTLPQHPNGMRLTAYDAQQTTLSTEEYYSIGGGFVLTGRDFQPEKKLAPGPLVPYPYHSGKDLLDHCQKENKSIAELMWINEKTWRTEAEIQDRVALLWSTMESCIQRGCLTEESVLPGGLKLKRRAPGIFRKLTEEGRMDVMDWANVFALAVNEENAAGGRVVTAPTNGAAGIIPAVFAYHLKFTPLACVKDAVTYFLTAGAIGLLFKENASISAAEVGCQGEVGVACAMAAAGLCALLGGTPEQVENAAEIGMEHHLGLTCDPISGLVQIPCIERNTMGTLQAINSAKLAMMGDGDHFVSLDQVIHTMRETGHDMQLKYKETSLGGLAAHRPNC